ncbi:hypothetical protein Taitung222_11460 [Helicobacter pylori]
MIALRNTRKLDLISVNPNQSLLAQLNKYDRKKSALKNGLNNRFKVHNNLVGYDDLTMAQFDYGSKDEYHRFISNHVPPL